MALRDSLTSYSIDFPVSQLIKHCSLCYSHVSWAETCHLKASDFLNSICYIFELKTEVTTNMLKLLFEEPTDTYGRIIIYNLDFCAR